LPRQQTLRALIDWSYDLLSEEEKHLLQFASVFVGGWTLDALEAVADDPETMEQLEALVNKSLVVAQEREREMRYLMLETIRQYAREKLFEARHSSTVRDRHFVYFDALSEKISEAVRSSDLQSPDLLAWRDRVEEEAENFRAAVEWGLENHVEGALHLAANYCGISDWFGRLSEGMMLVQSAIARVRSLPPVSGTASTDRQKRIARALLSQATAGMSQGNLPFALQSLHEVIAISRATGDKFILGNGLLLYTVISSFISVPGGSEAAQEALTIFTGEITDPWGLSMAYLSMARIASAKGNLSEKQKYIGKLKGLIGEASLSYQAGMLFLIMGMDESAHGNYESAKHFFEDGLDVFTRLKYKHFQLATKSELGHIARHTGDLQQAKQIYSETIIGWKDLGNRGAIAHQLECFAFIAIAEEEPQRALKLFGAAEILREKVQSPMADGERIEYDQAVAQVRLLLNESQLSSLWAEGRAMSMEQAVESALSAATQ
jgi:tetratricopeptide (TPR) repeat protein